jgi:RNA polymerase sigma-70 factor (ECF subfamily)
VANPQTDEGSRVVGLREGDAWVNEAYSAHGGELYGLARRALGDDGAAEEAVQETFVRAWRSRRRFDPGLGSRRTWLFAIARHVIADIGRKRSRRPAAEVHEIAPEPETLDDALIAWQVEEGLRRIGEAHRLVLVETQLRGRSHAEVAAELGVPEGTIKSRLYYGLRALRNVLEEMGHGD